MLWLTWCLDRCQLAMKRALAVRSALSDTRSGRSRRGTTRRKAASLAMANSASTQHAAFGPQYILHDESRGRAMNGDAGLDRCRNALSSRRSKKHPCQGSAVAASAGYQTRAHLFSSGFALTLGRHAVSTSKTEQDDLSYQCRVVVVFRHSHSAHMPAVLSLDHRQYARQSSENPLFFFFFFPSSPS